MHLAPLKVAVELPEKQGLKHMLVFVLVFYNKVAVELPEKQGLKLKLKPWLLWSSTKVAVELPEKQGLKQMFKFSREYQKRLQWNFQKNKD